MQCEDSDVLMLWGRKKIHDWHSCDIWRVRWWRGGGKHAWMNIGVSVSRFLLSSTLSSFVTVFLFSVLCHERFKVNIDWDKT